MQLKPRVNVQWTEETVDNEFLNRKKSKICCIYEKPKTHPDDTSSESSDSDAGNNYDKFPRH
jgi:protein phosphatase 1 regulatory subunit 11